MSHLVVELLRATRLTEREQRRWAIIQRTPLPPFPALETLSDGAGRDVEVADDTSARQRERTARELTAMEREEAKKISWDFADAYWSLGRFALQAVTFAAGAVLLGIGAGGVVSAALTGPGGIVAAIITGVVVVGLTALLVRLSVRANHVRHQLGDAARLWAAHAATVGSPADIAGGWRRVTRIVLLSLGMLVAVITMIAVPLTLLDRPRTASEVTAGIWIGVEAMALLVFATFALVSAVRGLRPTGC